MLAKMRTWIIGTVFAQLAVATAQPLTRASAQTFDVKQLEIKQGSLELGLDNTTQQGLPRNSGSSANRSAHDQSLDYGLLDWWRLSAVLKLENPQDADFRIAKAAVENLFVLKAIDDQRPHDIGVGWFTAVETSVNHDTTNSLIFGPIMTLKSEMVTLAVNPFFEKTFGRNHIEGIALNYGWQVKYELQNGFAIGVEGFGVVENLGNPPSWSEQEHRIGPAIFTEIALTKDFKIAPDIGLLFGLTSATPDVALKFNVGIPLHQR